MLSRSRHNSVPLPLDIARLVPSAFGFFVCLVGLVLTLALVLVAGGCQRELTAADPGSWWGGWGFGESQAAKPDGFAYWHFIVYGIGLALCVLGAVSFFLLKAPALGKTLAGCGASIIVMMLLLAYFAKVIAAIALVGIVVLACWLAWKLWNSDVTLRELVARGGASIPVSELSDRARRKVEKVMAKAAS